jgi:hypothetical protein
MPRIVPTLVVLYTAVTALGCKSPTEATSTSAAVSLSANPSPATASPTSGVFYILQGDANNADQRLEYPFLTSFTVSMAETGGEALDIISISVKVQQATGGIITPPTNGEVEHYQFVSSASGKTVPAKGGADVGFQVWYALPNLRRECVATVSINFVDRKGTPDDTSDDIGFGKTLDVQIQ